jgi:hypothetical protein
VKDIDVKAIVDGAWPHPDTLEKLEEATRSKYESRAALQELIQGARLTVSEKNLCVDRSVRTRVI